MERRPSLLGSIGAAALIERFKNLRIRTRFFLVFGFVTILVAALGAYAVLSIREIGRLAALLPASQSQMQDIATSVLLLSVLVIALIVIALWFAADSAISAVETLEALVKNRTAELSEVNAKNTAILAGIGDAVFAIDTEGKIILFNPIAELVTHVHAQDAVGKHYEEVLKFIHEDSGKPSYEFIASSLQGRHSKMDMHTLLIRSDGIKIPVADSAAPVFDEQDRVTGAVVVFRDTTQEHEVDRAKSEFVSLASHQLRTPIAAIRWYAELLLGGDGGRITNQQREFIAQIDESSARMASLVNSLLNVSRIDLGTLGSEPAPTDLAAMADSVIGELGKSIFERKENIVKDYAKDLKPYSCDQNLMRILFQNLISNAVKYTPDGGTVTVSIAQDDTQLHIKVADTGYGIPDNAKDKMFTKLYRADNIRDKDTNGNGLGLYLVKAIVEGSEGKISYTSKLNEGTTFFIDLPIKGMKKIDGSRTLSPDA